MRLVLLTTYVLLIAATTVVSGSAPAHAACNEAATLRTVHEECGNRDTMDVGAEPVDLNEYRVLPICAIHVGTACGRVMTCTNQAGNDGTLYQLWVNGERSGETCIAEAEPGAPPVLTPGQVLRAMQRLDWPASTLVIQPPDGLTLVNFDTNFFTTSTRPITRTVRLLGRPITIEATPSRYRWDFGDGAELTTTDPGAAYPELTVTHRYARVRTYEPSLDTTYSGRYRVGDGPWQTIPGTVTIEGTPQRLRAIEAQPQLVGY